MMRLFDADSPVQESLTRIVIPHEEVAVGLPRNTFQFFLAFSADEHFSFVVFGAEPPSLVYLFSLQTYGCCQVHSHVQYVVAVFLYFGVGGTVCGPLLAVAAATFEFGLKSLHFKF